MINVLEKSYEYHEGTIKVSGGGEPKSIGSCAVAFWSKGIKSIDFLWMGHNAGGQATKACLDAKAKVEAKFNVKVKFNCFSCKVEAVNPTTGERSEKVAYYWRMEEDK